MPRSSRREFMLATTALALGALPGCAHPGTDLPDVGPWFREVLVDPETARLPEVREAFPIGQLSGDARPDAVVVVTRYTGPHALSLRILALDAAAVRATTVVREVDVVPDDAGFVRVDPSGLEPGARHLYAFVERDRTTRAPLARGPLGAFRTALADDTQEVVTFAVTSCTHQLARPFPVLQHASAHGELDFLVHLGDHTYCDGARTLEQFRRKYEENWSAGGMRALHGALGQYCTWDDHEVENNWEGATVDPVLVDAARRAFVEHTPLRLDPATPGRLWRRVRWGRTLELFVLDCRSERRPATRRGPDAEYISEAQLAWLLEGLATSPAAFKFVLNSVPITRFPGAFALGADDRWEGYAAQRARVMDFMVHRAPPNVWWLSGDFHFGAVTRMEPSGEGFALREVLAGPGGNSPNPLVGLLRGAQWEFLTGEDNVAVLRADPARGVLGVSFLDRRGATLFAREYGPA